MSKFKIYLTESDKFQADRDKITWGSSVSSVPEYDGDDVLVFRLSDGEELNIKYYDKKEKKIYAFTDSYDKTFKNLEELVKYLNKNKAKFIGVNDYI